MVQAYSTIYIDLPQELLAVLETDVKERLNTKVAGLSFVSGNSAASTRDLKRVLLTVSAPKRFRAHLQDYGKGLQGGRIHPAIAVNLQDYPDGTNAEVIEVGTISDVEGLLAVCEAGTSVNFIAPKMLVLRNTAVDIPTWTTRIPAWNRSSHSAMSRW